MSKFNIGDSVKVTFDGEVVYIDDNGSYEVRTNLDMGPDLIADWLPAEALTLIPKPTKVGDVLSDVAAINALPVGSIARGHGTKFGHTKYRGGWSGPNGSRNMLLGGTVTVLHIGEPEIEADLDF